MAAATQARFCGPREGACIVAPVKGGVQIFPGTIVMCAPADGFAKPGATAAAQRVLGVSQSYVDNRTGADGAVTIELFTSSGSHGTREYIFANNQADALAAKDIGGPCYILDDSTVTATATGKTQAGTVMGFTPDNLNVYVRFAL